MNAQIITKISINALPEQVFTFLSHLEHHTDWNPKLDSVDPASGLLKKGSRYQSTSLLIGVTVVSQITVTRFRSNREIQFDNLTGVLRYSANYSLTVVGSKTIVTCDTTVSADNAAFKLATPILKKLAKAELQADLRALKRLAEQKH